MDQEAYPVSGKTPALHNADAPRWGRPPPTTPQPEVFRWPTTPRRTRAGTSVPEVVYGAVTAEPGAGPRRHLP